MKTDKNLSSERKTAENEQNKKLNHMYKSNIKMRLPMKNSKMFMYIALLGFAITGKTLMGADSEFSVDMPFCDLQEIPEAWKNIIESSETDSEVPAVERDLYAYYPDLESPVRPVRDDISEGSGLSLTEEEIAQFPHLVENATGVLTDPVISVKWHPSSRAFLLSNNRHIGKKVYSASPAAKKALKQNIRKMYKSGMIGHQEPTHVCSSCHEKFVLRSLLLAHKKHCSKK